ncbi:MAG: TetR/AcrR family transcriptional regulator [Myxococcales bacterium]|nr:TetR/AcrR family transcriptional regulator [Myxococcales bacterium]
MAIESWKRLSAAERRAQLIELGQKLFNSRRYSDISVDDIAAAAGISKGLLYHYFPSKEEFFLAGVEHGSELLIAACDPDPALPYAEQLVAGVGAYLDYVEHNSFGYLNLFRGETASLPSMQRVCDRTREALAARLLRGIELPAAQTANTRLAIRGFQGFVEALVLDWLEHGRAQRRQVELLSLTSILGALFTGMRLDLSPDHPRLSQLATETSEVAAIVRQRHGFDPFPPELLQRQA